MSMKIPSKFNKMVVYKRPSSPTPPTPTALTFTALQNNSAVQLHQYGSPDPIVLNYSKNGGAWTTYNVEDVITLDQGETVAFSGVNDHFSKNRNNDPIGDDSDVYNFKASGSVNVGGNIMSLMNYDFTCTPHCFAKLFQDNSSIVDASQLTLPATRLAYMSYIEIFRNCSALTAAPQVFPAADMTNADYCLCNMFWDCQNLVVGPAIMSEPAAQLCYINMFIYCYSLTSITVGFTTWGSQSCFGNWVAGVGSNGTFTKPTALSEDYGSESIPYGWTVVNI